MRERISCIIAIVLLLLLIGASYFYAVQSGLKNLKYIPSQNSPEYTAKNVTVTSFNEQGEPLRRLSAKEMLRYSDERTNTTAPKLITLERTKPRVVASAERGWSNDGGETVLFEGAVRVTRDPWQGAPAMSFSSEKLTVYPDTERFVSKAPVVFTRGADTTSASSMDYDHVNGTIELAGNVKTHMARGQKK